MSVRRYVGICDASAAARIGRSRFFAAASDEDCALHVFDSEAGGDAVSRVDLTDYLEPGDDEPEADIEGAAHVGGRIYWVGSHGLDKNGRERRIRQRLFATEVSRTGTDIRLEPVGTPCAGLKEALVEAKALRGFDLAASATRPPEEPHGLNIEGLAPLGDDGLLVGFRNPIPDGRALLVALHNPAALIEKGAAPEITLGGWLDLGGRGIRAIEFVPGLGEFLIVAGAYDASRNFAVYRWDGRTDHDARRLEVSGLDALNPEELLVHGIDADGVHVDFLSDDGDEPMPKKRCKKVDPAERRFRATRQVLHL